MYFFNYTRPLMALSLWGAFLFLSQLLIAQEDPYKKAQTLYSQGQYEQAEAYYTQSYQEDPECGDCYTMVAWCMMNQGKYNAEALEHAKKGQMISPLLFLSNVTLGHLQLIVQGDKAQAKTYFQRSLLHQDGDKSYQQLKQHLTLFKQYESVQEDYAEMEKWLENYWQDIKKRKEKLTQMSTKVEQAALAQDYQNVRTHINATADALQAFPHSTDELIAAYYYQIAQALLQNKGEKILEADKQYAFHTLYDHLLHEALLGVRNTNVRNPYLHYRSLLSLGKFQKVYGQWEAAAKYYYKALPYARATQLKGLDLIHLSNIVQLPYYDAYPQQEELAHELIRRAPETPYEPFFLIHGWNCLAKITSIKVWTAAGRQTALDYANKAYQKAKALDYTTGLADAAENKAMILLITNQLDKAEELMDEAVELNKKSYHYLEAAKELNAYGSLLLMNQKYIAALRRFRTAAELVESYRTVVPPAYRVAFLNTQSVAYNQMAKIYALTGAEKNLFTVMERTRGRSLREKLEGVSSLETPSIKDLQKSLDKEEVLLMYSNLQPGMVAILAISKKDRELQFVNDTSFIYRVNQLGHKIRAEMKAEQYEKLAQRGTYEQIQGLAQDDFSKTTHELRELFRVSPRVLQNEYLLRKRDSMLAAYHNLLIQPIRSFIADKEKLIISPDGYLSFIPFESLKNQQGQYLVENHQVSYVPSAGVRQFIEGRDYGERKKKVLAFGGPHFSNINEKEDTSVNRGEELELQSHILRNTKLGLSQRDAIIAIQGHSTWMPLEGTLKEVEAIKDITRSADVYTGKEANEEDFKQLNKSKKLQDYRIIHFATHGIVFPKYPELSSVVLSQFKEEQAGEDGYLTMAEISKMQMRADFVGLSACQTGLGGIYEGEGVVGLTQAFLQAGANGVCASLWSIDDRATQLFMTEVYRLVEEEQLSFAAAIAQTKRKFISGAFGEAYQHPNYWAPFAYYGK